MKTLQDGEGKDLKEKNMETGAVHALKEREQGSPPLGQMKGGAKRKCSGYQGVSTHDHQPGASSKVWRTRRIRGKSPWPSREAMPGVRPRPRVPALFLKDSKEESGCRRRLNEGAGGLCQRHFQGLCSHGGSPVGSTHQWKWWLAELQCEPN
jgi:hypothetical protein